MKFEPVPQGLTPPGSRNHPWYQRVVPGPGIAPFVMIDEEVVPSPLASRKMTSTRSVGLPMQSTPSLKGAPISVEPCTSMLGWFARACVTVKLMSSAAKLALPFAVKMPPTWQILLGYLLTTALCVGMIWLCARIYRIGILMYGKRPSFQEIIKWIRYK